MEEVAAAVAKEAVTVASTGNLAALLVFVLLLGGIIVIVLGVAMVKERGKRREDPPPNCPPPGGCPEIVKVTAQIESLTRELKRDGEERRDHRAEVRESVLRIHDRLDDTVTRQEILNISTISHQVQEEMNRGLVALTTLAETIRTAQTRRRQPTTKRSAQS